MFKITIELEDDGHGEFRYEVEGKSVRGTTMLEQNAAELIHKALRRAADEIKASMSGKSGTNVLEEDETDYRNFFGLN